MRWPMLAAIVVVFAQVSAEPLTPLKIAVVHQATTPGAAVCVEGTSPNILADDTGIIYKCVGVAYVAVPSGGTVTHTGGALTNNLVILGANGADVKTLATTSAGKFLRDDSTWVTLNGGGDAIVANPLSQFAETTSAQLAGVLSDEQGTDKVVFNTSPTLVTPTLGAATATTINKVTITTPATASTLTIDNGFTLRATANATVSGSNTGDQTCATTSGCITDAIEGVVGGNGIAVTGTTIATASGEFSFLADSATLTCTPGLEGAAAMETSGSIKTCADGDPHWTPIGNSLGAASYLALASSPFYVDTSGDTAANVGDFLKVTAANTAKWEPFAAGVAAAETDASHDTCGEISGCVVGAITTGDQLVFKTIDTSSGTDPVADTTTDTLTITAGSGVTVTGDSATDTVTISATGLTSKCDAWPVDSIFISISATNPGTTLGCGTWSAFATGRVLVGIDSGDATKDAAEETGGAKTVASSAQTFTGTPSSVIVNHTHTVTNNVGTADGTFGTYDSSSTSPGTAKTSTTSNPDSGGAASYTPAGTNAAGAATSVEQPYIAVYMWKRSA